MDTFLLGLSAGPGKGGRGTGVWSCPGATPTLAHTSLHLSSGHLGGPYRPFVSADEPPRLREAQFHTLLARNCKKRQYLFNTFYKCYRQAYQSPPSLQKNHLNDGYLSEGAGLKPQCRHTVAGSSSKPQPPFRRSADQKCFCCLSLWNEGMGTEAGWGEDTWREHRLEM